MLECSFNFFETSDFLHYTSHFLTIITMPIDIFGFYLIYFKIHPSMKNMREVLVYSHMCLIGDISIGTLTIPYVYIPSMSGTALGWLDDFGISYFVMFYFLCIIIIELAASAVLMFENRHYQAVRSAWKIETKVQRFIFIFLNCFTPFIILLPIWVDIPDQTDNELLQISKCIPSDFYELPNIIITNDPHTAGFICFVLLFFYTIQCIFFVTHTIYSLYFSSFSKTLSSRTKKMQRKYLISVIIQISSLFLSFALPFIYFVFSIIYEYYNQAFNNFCFIFMSIYGCISTLTTILTYDHFRTVCFKMMQFKETTSMFVQQNSVMNTVV
ncbi:unnamed protein product [Caenorhabditis angaria]|uniref:Serpentine Receptor, class H n=1 Tax=Caenorhabditis angaria TaxID=860376 RepID=A0A9P1IRQ0_9PELO|nr:unnamed protein product [Caenorhabditis angaria]